jgi:hypothetical protein
MITKILPFLNDLIPTALAFKGLSKLNPKIGKYLSAATAAGYGAKEALGYLKEQLGGEEQEQGLRPDEQAANARVSQGGQIPRAIGKAAQIGAGAAGAGLAATALPEVIGGLFGGQQEQAPSPENQQPSQQPQSQQEQNPIAKYSPELLQFIEQHIQSGRSPLEAGALARLPGNKFDRVIAKIEKDSGMKFSEILEKIYGGKKGSQQPQGQSQQQGQQPQQAQQKANVDQALLAAFDKILKM